MNTLITGMVGSHLADYLLENTDWDIHGMCRWRSPQDSIEHLIPRVNNGDRVFFHYGDLRDYISLQNVIKLSIHLGINSENGRKRFPAPGRWSEKCLQCVQGSFLVKVSSRCRTFSAQHRLTIRILCLYTNP